VIKVSELRKYLSGVRHLNSQQPQLLHPLTPVHQRLWVP